MTVTSYLRRPESITYIGMFIIAILIFEYFIRISEVSLVAVQITNMQSIIVAYSMLVAGLNICIVHGKEVMKKQMRTAPYSVLLLSLFILLSILAIVYGQNEPTFTWLNKNIYQTSYQGTSMLIGVFCVTGLYRAVKVRTYESLLLTLMIFIGIIGMTAMANIIPGWRPLSTFISDSIGSGGERAVTIGTALGLIALTFRTFIGQERHFG